MYLGITNYRLRRSHKYNTSEGKKGSQFFFMAKGVNPYSPVTFKGSNGKGV